MVGGLVRDTLSRSYDWSSRWVDTQNGKVAEVHVDKASAQVSVLPDDVGFLIRVWPQEGTHEYGGGNSTALSLVIRFDDDGKPTLTHFDFWDHVRRPTEDDKERNRREG
jgi:hypothetical protein